MGMIQEFKEFAMKGNVVDLAVGVVIGGAFGAIVNSMVGDIVMPVIGVLTGGVDFTGLAFKVGEASIAYGKFIQSVFTFLIIAAVLFLVIKAMNATKKAEAAAPAPPAGPSSTDQLLMEIRDALKK
ncbi:MAG: large-conductance mechanosensitive channel protein MscL [Chitinophagales bacterium]|jgi:large conductance mechanosensitive channel|nr:large-conductance mechanosensitive channel protein MscL [Chitinophagales bacterium]